MVVFLWWCSCGGVLVAVYKVLLQYYKVLQSTGAGSLWAHFLDRFGRKFWIASGGRSGRKLLSSAGVVLGSTE